MRLKLYRPIAFIDIESTGTNRETDRIIEFSVCTLFPNGAREVTTRRVNPGIPIPAGSTAIHGIKDEDVATLPPFSEYAKPLLFLLEGCDIGGFASNDFDIPLLYNEFQRCGFTWDYTKFKMIDAGRIFKIQEARTLAAAVKFYCGHELEHAHTAEADIKATVDVFLAQMERYPDLPENVDDLHLFCNYGKPLLDLSGKFSYDGVGNIVFNFGKYRGEPALDYPDFIEWMLAKGTFSPDTRKICFQLLESRYGEGVS